MPGADYGFYIWSAYGVTALAVAALLVRAVFDHRAQLRALARLESPARGKEETRHG
ncbi:heme exporter protein CcmD [uncultured Enterovirga sp.]|uniref:heme exporter protein CcmD n=1 Tax=uncultured Enterovirga sp. TaxID=2026352 RepID=UPI0035C9820C